MKACKVTGVPVISRSALLSRVRVGVDRHSTVTIEGHGGEQGLGPYLGPCWFQGAPVAGEMSV